MIPQECQGLKKSKVQTLFLGKILFYINIFMFKVRLEVLLIVIYIQIFLKAKQNIPS